MIKAYQLLQLLHHNKYALSSFGLSTVVRFYTVDSSATKLLNYLLGYKSVIKMSSY